MLKLRSERMTLPLRTDGSLKVAIVADTHSVPHKGTKAILQKVKPDAILHAGDIGDRSVIDDLAKIAPTYAVRGNIDEVGLPDDLLIDLDGLATVFLTHIAVNGPKIRADAARRAHAAEAKIVVCGHSHVPFLGRDKNLVVFNPGSIGPRRFTLPIVFGIMDVVDSKQIRFEHISCETGERWLP